MLFDPAGKETFVLLAQPFESPPEGHASMPRLALHRDARWRNLGENLLVLLRRPAARGKFSVPPYFRDRITGPLPGRAFVAALLWHIVAILLLLNFGRYIDYQPHVTVPTVEITWYGPVNDLPLIAPANPPSPAKPLRELARPSPKRGADAFHPRQTILNRPLRPNHPRQTLIEPAAPPVPPKILPSLPNIVAWNQASLSEPRFDPALLRQTRPKQLASRPQTATAAPEIPNQQKLIGPVDITALDINHHGPVLPIAPMSVPYARSVRAVPQPPPTPPASGVGPSSLQLIALSATPGPAMPPAIPVGNLSSHLAISPKGPSPGSPGTPAKKASGPVASAENGSGPAGLSITGGHPLGLIISSGGRGGSAHPVTPGLSAAAPRRPVVPPVRTESSPLVAALKPGMPPETLLGAHVYTLHINMPNMTSASGSWVLSFSELAPPEEEANGYTNPPDLEAPDPLRKVDPKYPPALRDRHIQGNVVLYAVIRKDGSVDSIQLVQGIDPTLDADAMRALAQWKFRPAERDGHPVSLQAIVYIPFRAVAPVY